MKLSKNFYLSEFTKSQTAARHRIDNTPKGEHLQNLQRLVDKVLQPVRDQFNQVVTVSSGYRSLELNKRVGGSLKSQHMSGEAADIEILSLSNYELATWIAENLEFDQLILEFAEKGDPNAGWVHVSYREGNNRGEKLTAIVENGETVYRQGLLET